jgi:hypothetical protein
MKAGMGERNLPNSGTVPPPYPAVGRSIKGTGEWGTRTDAVGRVQQECPATSFPSAFEIPCSTVLGFCRIETSQSASERMVGHRSPGCNPGLDSSQRFALASVQDPSVAAARQPA